MFRLPAASLAIASALWATCAVALAGERPQVLIIHSYHAGMTWTEDQAAGLREALGGLADVEEEYLDSKRHPRLTHLPGVEEVIARKFPLDLPDLVVTTDDDAFAFVREAHERLFPEVPVVFSGVNAAPTWPDGQRWATGVVEDVDIPANVALIRAMIPDLRRLVVVVDKSRTGLALTDEVEALRRTSALDGVTVEIWNALSHDEMRRGLQQLGQGAAVLMLAYNHDRLGRSMGYAEAARMIADASWAPVFGVWDFLLGHGIVGGYLTGGLDQGRAAGQLSLRVLQGVAPADVPVIGTSPKFHGFDRAALERTGLSRRQLPPGGRIVNERASMLPAYEQYRLAYWTAGGVTSGMGVGLLLLATLLATRRRAQAAVERMVTERTELLSREIAERAAAERLVEEKARELARSNEELEQFAYVASHDLRQPLRIVISYVTLLERQLGAAVDMNSGDYIRFVRDGAHRMDRLIHDLLEYSRAGRADKALAPVDLNQVLTDALQDMAVAIEDSGAQLTTPANAPGVIGCEMDLVRLFNNLIGNAIKYRAADRPPQIAITVEQRDGVWRFVVADNGIGIEPDHLDRIFGVFQRLHVQSEYDGTGIGLAVCKRIVERHGGTIHAESEPGQGSRFVFTLPMRPELAKEGVAT
ncbi:MAG: GHKL domain-containing protein [Alphaproteobacteria bacterium]|nr:GHKL domain-containing protein [Alphaproteobacteria bacterium]